MQKLLTKSLNNIFLFAIVLFGCSLEIKDAYVNRCRYKKDQPKVCECSTEEMLCSVAKNSGYIILGSTH
jgi:hypothetical protein